MGTKATGNPGNCTYSLQILNLWNMREKCLKWGDKLPKIPHSENSTKMRTETAENYGFCASNSRQIPMKIV